MEALRRPVSTPRPLAPAGSLAGLGAAALGSVAASLGSVVFLRRKAARWRRQTLARLAAGSRLVSTARGPIEVATVGLPPLPGTCPLLTLHGTPGGYDQGLAIAGLLGDRTWAVVAPSRPGYLRTPLAVGRTPAEQADALVALLDALGVTRAGVVAVSGGGPAALHLALRHPARVARLVLWQAVTAPGPPAPARPPPAPHRLVGCFLASDLGAWLGLRALGLAARLRLLDQSLGGHTAVMRLLPLAATAFPFDRRRAGALNDVRQRAGALDWPLRAIRVPTLLVHGRADRNVPYAQAVAATAAIPGARLVTVPDGTHITTLAAPQATRAIAAFVACGAPSAAVPAYGGCTHSG